MRQDILKSLPKGAKVLSDDETLTSLPKGIKVNTVSQPEVSNPYFDDISKEQGMDKLNLAIESVPNIDDTHKKILKDLALKGTKKEDLKTAILTFQGQHPLQEGGNKYYYNEKGIPVPLKSNERPPAGFDVANDLHGTQKEANEVGFLNSAGRHIYNGVLKGVLGLEAMANLPYGLITGEDADWYKSAKNRVESSLYKTPEYEHEEQLWDPKETKDIGDVLLATINPSNYNINKNTVQGAALQGMESVISFLVGTKGMGAVTKLAAPLAEGAGLLKAGSVLDEAGNIVQQGSKATDLLRATSSAGVKAQAFGGAYSQSYPEIEKYVEDAGVTGKEKYGLSATIAIPFAFTEMMFGTEGLFVKNQAAKAAKQKVIQGIVDGAKRGEGPLTEEYLANVFKATTSEAAKLNKSFARELAGNIAEEAGTEAFQEFQKQGLTKMYDKLSGDENFKQDPFSFEAFKDYYNSALSGAFGAAGPSTMATFNSRNREVKEIAANNIYNTVQKGDAAVDVLKKNIGLAVKDGDITADQALESIYRVDSYAQYHNQTKGLDLTDEDKKKVFDLTFQKQNLEAGIPSEYEAEKLNGIEQAQIEAKRKQAKLLQDDINKIIFKEQVKSGTEKTSEAVKDEIRKDSDKQFAKNFKIKVTEGNDVLQDEDAAPEEFKYKVPEVITNEKRTYNDIPIEQWNDPKFNTRVKQFKLAEHLSNQEGDIAGVINEDNAFEDKGHKIQTFNVTLPDGKSVRFASSMVRRPTKDEKGGYRGNTYEENFDNRDNPIGAKVGLKVVKLKDSGRKVVFIYNAEEGPKKGRHIGMVKESLRGNSNYSKADLDEMAELRMTNMAEGGAGIIEEITPKEPIAPADVKIVQPKVKLTKPTRENLRKQFIEDKIEAHKKEGTYYAEYDKIYEARYGSQFDRLNPTLYAETTTGEEQPVAGTDEKTVRQDTGISQEKKVRKGTPRSQQKIKNKARLDALKLEVFTPKAIIMQHFIGGGKLSFEAVKSFYKGSLKEARSRSHLVSKNGPTFDELAHDLWEANKDVTPNATDQDYKNELEEVIQEYIGPVSMAEDLLKAYAEKQQMTPNEEVVHGMHKQAEEEGTLDEVDAIQDNVEKLNDEEKARISEDQKSFNDWEGEQKDIITGEEGDYPFEPKGEYENKQKYKTKEGEEIPYTSLAQESEQGSLDLFGEEDKNSNYDSGVKDEICWMERRMSKGQVSLTGNSTIKSSADVAYLFRHLESAVSENAFVVFTKNDDSYNVLYLATGSTIGVMVDAKMVYAAAKDFGATGVYFVHNHPTGNLKPSQPDYTMHGKLLRMFSNTDVKVHDSVIINLDSGQYTEFGQSTHQQLGTKGKPKKEIDVPVHSFDKQILYTPSFEKTSITSSADVASFLSKQKRGIIPKLGIIVLDRKNAINRYIMLDDSLSGKELLDKIIYNVGKSGESVIMVTNDKFNVTDINDIKKELAVSEITLLDAIHVNPDPSIVSSYKSFVDEGMIGEPKEEYASEEGRKYSKEEKKEQRKQERSRLEELLGVDDLNDFKSIKDAVANMSMEDLILAYNEIVGFQTSTKNKAFNNVKREIAYRTFTKRKEEIKKEYPDKFIEEMANKTDLKPKDVLMKALSHMTESFPELQEFSKMFDSSFFDMTAERYTLKNQLEKLGKKVIEEKNKQLGIIGRLGALFSSDNAKYFDFVEKDGKYLTVAEAKAKGLSDNQIKFLEFMHKLNDLRNEQLEQMGGDEVDDVLKVDKGWKESFKTEGILQAFSAYLGNGFNLRNVRIKYTDPVTGNVAVAPYGEVEKKLYEYGEKGKMEKAKALALMLRYNFRAKKQVESGVNQDEKENKNVLKLMRRSSHQLNPFGALDNKFLKGRDKDRGYSKDFYKAAFDFVDDYTHTKHMSPLLPYIDSIEFLNEQGIIGDDGEILHAAKPQVVKWIKDWKDLHLFKTDKAGALGPEVDASLRTLRKLTSLMVMAFNWVAGAWNISMGIYNNIRSETAEIQGVGLKRLFAGKDRGSLGLVNKKAQDILEKYHVVSIDYNSNPKLYAGRAFDQMAHGVTRAGEYVIQGSMFAGLMTEEDWNSFEYKTNKNGTEELVLKEGVDEKAFKERMIANKNKVSDIQGKYGEKDARNYMISEFGKAVGQFKVWLPDAWKTRFGEEYIDRDGKVHKGTWRQFYGQGIKDLQAEIKEKGHLKAFWENKDAMSNIKGLAMVAVFLSLKFGGDDDEKKRRGGDIIDKALAQLFLGFDPQGTKFTFQNPVAATGPVLKLIDAVKHGLDLDGEKVGKDLLKIAPYNKIITQIPELIAGED